MQSKIAMVYSLLGELMLVSVSVLDDILLLSEEACLSVANGLGVLGHPIRRKVLDLLSDRETMNREELAEEIAADEAVPAADLEVLNIDLHHRHLPKLDYHQYLAYDYRSGDVRLWNDSEATRSEP